MDDKPRHGCVTAYLVFMIATNALLSVVYVVAQDFILGQVPQFEPGLLYALAVGGLVNVGCALALLRWKKWGFYGFAASAGVVLIINLMGGLAQQALAGPMGVGILWVIFQVKSGDLKAWDLLE